MIAFVQVTNKCKMRCVYCFYNTGHLIRSKDKRVSFSNDDLLRIAFERGISNFILTGGDPLHDEVFTPSISLIKKLRESGISAGMNTSLVLNCEEQAKLLIDAHPDIIFVSCDSFNPIIHDQQRAFGKETIRSIELLTKSGINVAVNCSVTKLNYHSIREIWNFFSDLGVSETYFNIVFIPSHSKEFGRLSCECLPMREKRRLVDDLLWWSELKPEKSRYWHTAMQSSMFLGINLDDSYKKHAVCRAGSEMVVIEQDGLVKPCFHPNNRWGSNAHMHDGFWGDVADEKQLPQCFGKHCVSIFGINIFWRNGTEKEVSNGIHR